jgi:hypothetical protein
MRNVTITSILLILLLLPLLAMAFTYPAYNGEVEFDHVWHRKNFVCGDCHDGPPRKMNLEHDSAHKFCMGCHRKLYSGPLQHCNDCHKLKVPKLEPAPAASQETPSK